MTTCITTRIQMVLIAIMMMVIIPIPEQPLTHQMTIITMMIVTTMMMMITIIIIARVLSASTETIMDLIITIPVMWMFLITIHITPPV